jgi:hypothetical protein
LQDAPKFTQIGYLGLKIYHLAALVGKLVSMLFLAAQIIEIEVNEQNMNYVD